jgi:hypothetical protein
MRSPSIGPARLTRLIIVPRLDGNRWFLTVDEYPAVATIHCAQRPGVRAEEHDPAVRLTVWPDGTWSVATLADLSGTETVVAEGSLAPPSRERRIP